MDETSHSILIVRVLGDAVGIGLDRGLGVGHSDSQSGETDHGYIVETVADSDSFSGGEIVELTNAINSCSL